MTNSAKWFRVRVTDMKTGENKTNVKIPVGLAGFGMKMALKFSPESVADLNLDEIVAAAKSGEEGLLVDVDDEENGEHVEIFIE